MILAGALFVIVGFGFLIFGAVLDDETTGKVLCTLAGMAMVLGFNCFLPPFKDRENEDFTVKTDKRCEIHTEIFINKDNVADTIYYYNFVNSTVKATK